MRGKLWKAYPYTLLPHYFPLECANASDHTKAAPVLPYRTATLPESLSLRLKHPDVLSTTAWLKRSPSDYSENNASRLRCSRSLDVDKRRARPASMAPEFKVIERTLPPPLPPKRTCSQSPVLPIPILKPPNFSNNLLEDELEESDGIQREKLEAIDVCNALQSITKRLDQMHVERSPILGHYSMLYRLDTCQNMRHPKQHSSYISRMTNPLQSAQRCAYTNFSS